MSTAQHILALERQALDQWSGGNAMQYYMHADEGITYFDDIGANRGLHGLDALKAHASAFADQVPAHRYELQGEQVQVYGDTAVLSYNYVPTTMEGDPSTNWRATIVYHNNGGDWKVVHMHWTMHKDA